jgi:hypothetical protein
MRHRFVLKLRQPAWLVLVMFTGVSASRTVSPAAEAEARADTWCQSDCQYAGELAVACQGADTTVLNTGLVAMAWQLCAFSCCQTHSISAALGLIPTKPRADNTTTSAVAGLPGLQGGDAGTAAAPEHRASCCLFMGPHLWRMTC